jgi:HPt (histidine-containing phosphotransfer) domain-containing protein
MLGKGAPRACRTPLITPAVPLRRTRRIVPLVVVPSPAMQGPPPSAPAVPSFQERFAAIEREWKQQLPARLQDARSRLDACRLAPEDRPALEGLHRVLHTLAGSAGTFGLGELGEGARAIELELDRLMALPARSGADFDPADGALQALVAGAPRT